ncbi:MAG TPA: cysteine--tRNA ligase [Erysipelothrix sp.]|nr:cysteine--tRNA ligase [Erysipelothrix sp.]
MKLFNTRSNQLETFVPLKENEVSLYLCGPTVYNHAHIGNARPIVIFDTLKKVFEALGYTVHYVSNFTDVDDRIIALAKEENKKETDITDFYIDAYNQIRTDLNADQPDSTPQVTQTIPEIIEFISELIKSEAAYEKDGNVYFRVDSVKDYGSLSHQVLEDLQVGARISENVDKENPLDFLLWKDTDDDGIKWQSPWGLGRPGWHTECVVMIHQEFKQHKIDIHGGGVDLRFPHHENEAAQNCALHNHDLANYWVHNAMINLDGVKMSKSLGNVHLAKDLIEVLGSNVVRWLLVSNHYRQLINITDETIEQSKTEINRIETALKQTHLQLDLNDAFNDGLNESMLEKFLEPMQDDLNTPNGVAVIFEEIKQLNQLLRQRDKDYDKISETYRTVLRMLEIMGIEFNFERLTSKQRDLYNQWNKAKSDKNFELADQLRAKLIELGIL